MRSRPPHRPGAPPPRGGGFGTAGASGEDDRWRKILCRGTAREILARLVIGDPLGLAQRCKLHVLEHGLLVNPTRLLAKTFARAAYVAALRGYHGKPELDVWLKRRIDEALEELRLDDAEKEAKASASPEFHSALDEVLHDPNAKLFVTTPRQLNLSQMGVVDPIGATNSDLTPAERHLLMKHREELGSLLLEAAFAVLERDPRTARSIRRVSTQVLELSEFEKRLQRLQAAVAPDRGLAALLARVNFSSAHRLALLSLRIQPTYRARQCLGMADCLELREFEAARRVFSAIAAEAANDQEASAALNNIGFCFDCEGQKHRALPFIVAAIREAPRVACLSSLLLLSMFFGDEGSASESLVALGDLPTAETRKCFEQAVYRKSVGRVAPGHMKRVFYRIESQCGEHRDLLASLCT